MRKKRFKLYSKHATLAPSNNSEISKPHPLLLYHKQCATARHTPSFAAGFIKTQFTVPLALAVPRGSWPVGTWWPLQNHTTRYRAG